MSRLYFDEFQRARQRRELRIPQQKVLSIPNVAVNLTRFAFRP